MTNLTLHPTQLADGTWDAEGSIVIKQGGQPLQVTLGIKHKRFATKEEANQALIDSLREKYGELNIVNP